jgi:hypothetical protein
MNRRIRNFNDLGGVAGNRRRPPQMTYASVHAKLGEDQGPPDGVSKIVGTPSEPRPIFEKPEPARYASAA